MHLLWLQGESSLQPIALCDHLLVLVPALKALAMEVGFMMGTSTNWELAKTSDVGKLRAGVGGRGDRGEFM